MSKYTFRSRILGLIYRKASGRQSSDRSREAKMRLLPQAAEEATAFLAEIPEAIAHVNRVSELVEGFETPYGMELLATTHWVVTRSNRSVDMEEAIALVHDWSSRKQQLFKPNHIRTAWQRLYEQGWLENNS